MQRSRPAADGCCQMSLSRRILPETLSVVYASHEFKIGSGNYSEKLRRLAEVMADVKQRGLDIAYVDLRPERQAAAMVVKNADQRTGPKAKSRR